MKIAPYVEKLSSSSEFKTFQKENKDSYMMAGFFVLDMETGKNIHQIDYYVPSKRKVAAFTLDRKINLQLLDLIKADKIPEKLDIKTKIDLDQLQGILKDEMHNRNMTDDIKKIIAIVQNLEGKKIWNLNCVLSGMGILNAHVDDDSKTVLKMEKKSLIDIMQKMPSGQMRTQNPVVPQHLSKEDVKAQLKKLDDIEKEIEKEKEALKNSSNKSKKKK
jgi:hypothetical protein